MAMYPGRAITLPASGLDKLGDAILEVPDPRLRGW
jgi:hypothetical protein